MSDSLSKVAISLTAFSALCLPMSAYAGNAVTGQESEAPAEPIQEIPSPTMDTDNDGKPDAWDRDGDSTPDAWDTDGDGAPDLLDNDRDGKPDTAMDGKPVDPDTPAPVPVPEPVTEPPVNPAPEAQPDRD